MLFSKICSLFLMFKSSIFKAFKLVLIFIQSFFSKTPTHLADEMPTSEGVRQGSSSRLVSLLFLSRWILFICCREKGHRNENNQEIRYCICGCTIWDQLHREHHPPRLVRDNPDRKRQAGHERNRDSFRDTVLAQAKRVLRRRRLRRDSTWKTLRQWHAAAQLWTTQ